MVCKCKFFFIPCGNLKRYRTDNRPIDWRNKFIALTLAIETLTKMNKPLLIAILTLSSLSVLSQTKNTFYIGINSGVTNSKISGKNEASGYYNYKTGLGIGLAIEYMLNSKLSIETDVDFYQRGYNFSLRDTLIVYSYSASNSYIGYNENITLNYLNNTYTVGYYIGNKINLSINAGIYWAILLSSKRKATTYSFIDPVEWNEIGDPVLPVGYTETSESGKLNSYVYSNFDFGLIGKIDAGYDLNNKYQINCFLRYNKGFIDISKEYRYIDTKNYNISYCFGLGVKMNI